ncbi:hypothetical protein [Aureispira anguillae]|uniref:Uncharacterized protein n=1 Tax=Aureispira anguillae TaxID=2864201 RepID=A0A916DU44_9BACT|nr:hypothetical protein [Aureispira anguillae]BDS13824.1 hypothetical protein AsAng_0045860 [Aureispira anguillae]
MSKSVWWIGLSNEWNVIQKTSWNAPRPTLNPNVHMWIKKMETENFIRSSNLKKIMLYDYSVWDTRFRRRAFFPINKWSLVGLSTPLELNISSKVYLHLQDPEKEVKKILIDSDNNWNLTKAFTHIDYNISVFDNWASYEQQTT